MCYKRTMAHRRVMYSSLTKEKRRYFAQSNRRCVRSMIRMRLGRVWRLAGCTSSRSPAITVTSWLCRRSMNLRQSLRRRLTWQALNLKQEKIARKKPLPKSHTAQAVLESTEEVRSEELRAAEVVSGESKLLRWLNRGSLAILDQGLISGSNFLVSILLARWLAPDFYGAYAVAFGILVLLTLVYSALILEPMSVYGGAVYRSSLLGYVKSLLKMHAAVSLVFALLVSEGAILVSYSGRDSGLAGALLGVAIAAPCVLLLWVLRRALYLKMHSGRAAAGALLYCVLMVTGLWIFNAKSLLSPFNALLLMGAAALVASVLLIAFLRADF